MTLVTGREDFATDVFRPMPLWESASKLEVSAGHTAQEPPTGWGGTTRGKRLGTTIITSVSSMARVQIDVMQHHAAIGLVLLTACATPGDVRSPSFRALAIALSPGWIEERPALVVSVTNRSDAAICIRADAIRNPGSYEMDIRLRDARGRRVRLYPARGYFEPPLDEIIRVEPGTSLEGQYYLDRFEPIGARRPLPRGWQAQARVKYGNCQPREAYCDGRIGLCPDAWSSRATSRWQPLTFTERRQ